MKAVENLDFHTNEDRKTLSELVIVIDKEVSHIVSIIIKAGKTPIIIGGGHNNAYGNIKGAALAFQKPIKEGVELLNTIQDVYLDQTITLA